MLIMPCNKATITLLQKNLRFLILFLLINRYTHDLTSSKNLKSSYTMNNKNLPNLVVSIFPFILLTCLRPCNTTNPSSKKPEFRGIFVFGNSILDNGNNNFLNTALKANYLPYGIDFQFGATGRFTNNKNLVDHIGDILKLPLIPAFSNPQSKGVAISQGVNHASAGSGILDATGSNMVVLFS